MPACRGKRGTTNRTQSALPWGGPRARLRPRQPNLPGTQADGLKRTSRLHDVLVASQCHLADEGSADSLRIFGLGFCGRDCRRGCNIPARVVASRKRRYTCARSSVLPVRTTPTALYRERSMTALASLMLEAMIDAGSMVRFYMGSRGPPLSQRRSGVCSPAAWFFDHTSSCNGEQVAPHGGCPITEPFLNRERETSTCHPGARPSCPTKVFKNNWCPTTPLGPFPYSRRHDDPC